MLTCSAAPAPNKPPSNIRAELQLVETGLPILRNLLFSKQTRTQAIDKPLKLNSITPPTILRNTVHSVGTREASRVSFQECDQQKDCVKPAKCVGSSISYGEPELDLCQFCVVSVPPVCEKVADHCFCLRESSPCETSFDCMENEVCRTLTEKEIDRFELAKLFERSALVCAPVQREKKNTGKLNFEDCDTSAECESPRRCVYIDTKFERFDCPDEKQEDCSCVPEHYSCRTSADCPEGESCRTWPASTTPFGCVSDDSDFLIFSENDEDSEDHVASEGSEEADELDEEIVYDGLNGERCEDDSDCVGGRECINDDRVKCSLSDSELCLCMSDTPGCSPARECPRGEVCYDITEAGLCLSGRINVTITNASEDPNDSMGGAPDISEDINEESNEEGKEPLNSPVEASPSSIPNADGNQEQEETSPSSQATAESVSPDSSNESNGADEASEAVCIGSHLLRELDRKQLIFERDRMATVLCDANNSCATGGHVVQYKGTAMMMKSYCALAGCVGRKMAVNSPRYRRALRIGSNTHGLLFTAFAARYETKAEEMVLRHAVRLGL